MTTIDLEEVIRRAKACLTCGHEHTYRPITDTWSTWRSEKDGHTYRAALSSEARAWLEAQR